MADYDTIFLKHFYENFDFENCVLTFDNYNRLVTITNKLYSIELYHMMGTCRYTFCIKDKKVTTVYIQRINKYAKQLIDKVNTLRCKLHDKKETSKIMELNKFLESLHS